MTPGVRRAMLIPVVGLLLLGLWVYFALDGSQLTELLARARWTLVLAAVAASLTSYLLISTALLLIGRTMGMRRVPAGTFVSVAFVSLTLNHVVSFGVAGYSARVLLLRRGGESPGTVLAASLLHSYLTTLGMVLLLPLGLGMLAVAAEVPPAAARALELATVGSLLLAIAMTVALVSRRMRLGILALAGRLGRLLPGGGEGVARSLIDLDAGLVEAARVARTRPLVALLPIALTLLDWVAVTVAFWLCLEAVGLSIPAQVVLAGFAIGMNAGVLSLVPGGVGVQEGSQAGVLALFGVPFAPALLASVLFRVVYYLVPFFVSLPLYYVVLRPMVEREEVEDPALPVSATP